MNNPHDAHEPTAEFSEFLARDIVRTMRHDARFAPSARAQRVRRVGLVMVATLVTTGALAIGLVFGTSTGYASARSEIEQTPGRDRAAPRPPKVFRGVPVQRALAVTCNALSLAAPTERTAPAPAVAPAEPAEPVPLGIPTIDLPPASARTGALLGAVFGIRQLPGGRLLVDDAGHRQVRLFDSTLAGSIVTLDSTLGSANSYGASRADPLMRFLGDSSLLPDGVSRTIRVLDGQGQVARTIPMPNGAPNIVGFGYADDKGRLLYSSGPQIWRGGPLPRDSAALVRLDLASGRVDTVSRTLSGYGFALTMDRLSLSLTWTDSAKPPIARMGDPLPSLMGAIDDWAVLSDGSIAMVRTRDYHVDWIRADGTIGSGPKLPFEGKRVTDEEWRRFVDSMQAPVIRVRGVNSLSLTNAPIFIIDGVRMISGNGGNTAPEAAPATIRTTSLLNHYPAVRAGAATPDLDGNLWVLSTIPPQPQGGQLIYDVINARGELFQRVRMPVDRSLAGFGKGGIVYLLAGDRTNGYSLERTRLGGGAR